MRIKATIFLLIFLTIAQIAPAQILQPLGNGFPPNEVRDIFTHNGSLMHPNTRQAALHLLGIIPISTPLA